MEDKIEKVVDLAAPVSRVWRALTDHREFGEWFRVDLEAPFVVGEVSRGQITYPGHEHVKWWALVERMEHEQLFAMSWYAHLDDPDAATPDDPKTMFEFRLEPKGDSTRLTILEWGFAHLPEPQRTECLRRNSEGWDIQSKNIAAHVEA